MSVPAPPQAAAGDVVAAARAAGVTLAVAESLTGGLVCAALVAVPGASAVFRGGVVAYATDLKRDVLGVPGGLLAARGAVDGEVAAAMAAGARRLTGADLAVATTGVAGPDGQDGHAPGEVHVGLAQAAGARSRRLDLPGDRRAVRAAAVDAALADLLAALLALPGPRDGAVRVGVG